MNPGLSRMMPGLLAAGVLAAMLVVVALWRGGLLGLPSVPPGVTAARSGLANIAVLRVRAARLSSGQSGAATTAGRRSAPGQ